MEEGRRKEEETRKLEGEGWVSLVDWIDELMVNNVSIYLVVLLTLPFRDGWKNGILMYLG